MVALVDAYDALVVQRAYRVAVSHEEAVEAIASGRGQHFDPDVVDAFLTVQDQFPEARRGGTRAKGPDVAHRPGFQVPSADAIRASAGAADMAVVAPDRGVLRWIDLDLTFQEIDAELDGLPGDYAPPGGLLLVGSIDDRLEGLVACRRGRRTSVR